MARRRALPPIAQTLRNRLNKTFLIWKKYPGLQSRYMGTYLVLFVTHRYQILVICSPTPADSVV